MNVKHWVPCLVHNNKLHRKWQFLCVSALVDMQCLPRLESSSLSCLLFKSHASLKRLACVPLIPKSLPRWPQPECWMPLWHPKMQTCIPAQMSFFPFCSVSPLLHVGAIPTPGLPRSHSTQAGQRAGAQDMLVEWMGFELLSETEVPQSALGSNGSKNPLPGTPEVSQPRTPPHTQASSKSPNPFWCCSNLALKEAANLPLGTKELSGLMEQSVSWLGWWLWRCIHLSELLKLYT